MKGNWFMDKIVLPVYWFIIREIWWKIKYTKEERNWTPPLQEE